MRTPYNALWYQLLDYCGSFGPNRKFSKVIIHSSTNKDDVIQESIQFLRYFIRYFGVQKREIERDHIVEDNANVDFILSTVKRRKSGTGTNNLYFLDANSPKQSSSTLSRTKTFSTNLAKLVSLGDSADSVKEDDPVIFILGDNEKLINLKEDYISDNLPCVSEINNEFEDGKKLRIPEIDCKIKSDDNNAEENLEKVNVISFPLPRYD